ncbi:MAG TPA: crosslink repair DNA glycosylase YcaQ family protein, partial [Propionibacteriaceae bacterium]
MRHQELSKAEARRIALAAQGFGVPKLGRPVTMRDVQAVTNRLAQFQIDSINVVTRAQFMPLYSRLGPYDPALLQRAAYRPPRRLFEYWGHAASLIDLSLQPLLRFRMEPGFRDVWSGVERVARENADLIPFIRDEVAARGPISARDLEVAEERDRSNWGWNWSRVKTVLEWLFY